MRALLLKHVKTPLVLEEVTTPSPGHDQVLIRIKACALCRTDLHIIDGELLTSLPLILGHQVVGTIEEVGKNVINFTKGQPVGLPWLGFTCGSCDFCQKNQENLCDKALFTGYHLPGGFAEYTTAHYQYIFPLPDVRPEYAPLLCAGMIGFRSLKKCKQAKRIGFYGFGSAARLLLPTALAMKKEIYVFTRAKDVESQKEARNLGASWAGGIDEKPPSLLEAGIIFAPVGELIPLALNHLEKGGLVVSAGIHMSDIPSFSYDLIWGEKTVTTVANLTREDGNQYLNLSPLPVPKIKTYQLEEANQAIDDFRHGRIHGTAVILP